MIHEVTMTRRTEIYVATPVGMIVIREVKKTANRGGIAFNLELSPGMELYHNERDAQERCKLVEHRNGHYVPKNRLVACHTDEKGNLTEVGAPTAFRVCLD